MILPLPFSRRVPAVALAAGLLAPVLHAAGAPDFQREIRPILSNICFKCHGPDADERKGGKDGSGGLRLDTEEGARAALDDGAAIVPGHPEKSALVARIKTSDQDDLMPPPKSGRKLSPKEIALLEAWVKGGGKYERHWSYEKPRRPALPEVKAKSWVRNGVDAFILARLEKEGLAPQPEADRLALARRAALDITGLPPTPEEADTFAQDKAPDAYERYVDRLLASPAYGEHWARQWLDLARYADSAGYADDPGRTIWAYRDWVIRAFNANRPFDQFTIEQIAGDLLPGATDDQLIATAFHRNTMTNNEGGTNDEEFRNAAVVDRANTTMSVWMGTSFACAQCHTHKYDPITQAEYFQVFAILNNTQDADRKDESPVLAYYADEQKPQRAQWEAEIAALEAKLKAAPPAPAAPPDGAAPAPADDRKADEQRIAAVRKQLAGMKKITVPIMRDLDAGKRRKTKVQLRGNYLSLGEDVTEGVPAIFHPLPVGAPPNRLTLARWLVDDANPLTARVTVNRFWESIFGTGIVRTSEEFGAQGELPSHPELLDWLATELVREKWDLKKFLRLLVTSAAYRQSSKVTPELTERDPDNRLLARGPRFRLSAEMVRDQALAASGLLSRKMHGPPVRPPQPNLGLSAAFGRGLDWKDSTGEDARRRAVYTEWRRTAPYPSLVTFDAPNREVCTLRRNQSNTPLQALVTLNDPVFLEAAQALARRMIAGSGTAAEKAARGFRFCVTRPPTAQETARLVALHAEALAYFQKAPDKAAEFATKPIGAVPVGADVPDLAAWTAVANVLLNMDETLMKR
jgi:hypothetical protein